MSEISLVERYALMEESELYEELGKILLGETSLGMGSSSRGRLRRFGREKWLDSQRRLRLAVCTPEQRSKLSDGGTAIAQGLVSTVAQTLHFEQAEAAVVAVLILKMGLDKFCGTNLQDSNHPT